MKTLLTAVLLTCISLNYVQASETISMRISPAGYPPYLIKDKTGRQGYFIKHNGVWLLVNEKMIGLKNLTSGSFVKEGESVELVDGLQLVTGSEKGDRLFQVQMVYGLND